MKFKKRAHFLMQRSFVMLTTTLTIVVLLFFACGDTSDGEAALSSTNNDSSDDAKYASLKGEVRIDGSSTVFPISEAVAEEFSKVSKVRVNVAFSGTGGGFEKFCRGETQISDASRPMKDKEVVACAEKGINDVIELEVAIDALTVMINPENTWAQCMTVKELNYAFRAGGAKKWSDIRSDWPNKDIVAFYPGVDSGTFDYFNETIIEKFEKEKEHTHRADGTPSEDDNVLALGIGSDPHAIGYFGFAYYLGAGDELTAVQIDNGDGCIEPTFENALSGTYTPLSRPLYIYTRASLLDNPAVYGFLEYYLNNLGELVPDVGYITMPKDREAIMVSRLTERIVTHGSEQ
ncbi:MAG: PstS family phosphate ABC transporter substrate-binding protein [Tepidiformaceae bacterium]